MKSLECELTLVLVRIRLGDYSEVYVNSIRDWLEDWWCAWSVAVGRFERSLKSREYEIGIGLS